jgi:rfaE bifunctional protein nucleotidyltransferase chain/domain
MIIQNNNDLIEIRNIFYNKNIVYAHGCFDIFHIGHLNYLKESKKLGDMLVVSLTNNQFVNKGKNRPIFDINQRMEIIDSLKIVNYTCISNNFLCIEILDKLKPNIYTKGMDVNGKELIEGSNLYIENKTILKNNGKLIFVNSGTDMNSTELSNNL